jgi:succinate dehydrogenase / fumarate reductase flavoprotein subunit/L-aspartate oxidase
VPRTRNIAVIGSGAAGLTAALGAAPCGDCVLVTDGPLGRSNSMMAQGGLQLPLAGAESRQRFFDDIVRSARVALDETLVRNFVAHVEDTITRLQAWGLELDRNEDGALVRRLAGGLSEPRIVSARDQIGPAVVKVLRARVRESAVEVLEHATVTDLRPTGRDFTLTLRDARGVAGELRARAIVCCTGGITFREARRRHEPTTNPESRNHVLHDVLCGLGLTRVHADYFQYQPFGIVGSEWTGVGRCVPESIVNFGVDILDRSGASIGDIRQDRWALTQRMFEVIAAGGAERTDDGRPGLRLTLGDVDAARLAAVFPKVHQYLSRAGLLGRHILVHPFLHYYLGGLRITARCESEIPGLFLAGEIVGGLHGRNRLMGNGITDSLVHGDIAGRSAREYLAG